MPRPVIALLTDFGLRDHYVAAMKGVMLGICPEATFIDISHDIAPQDIVGGALELEAVAPYLPAGTVVAAVVDPGVGSARRAVAVEAGPLRFVGPDNGLLWMAVNRLPGVRTVALTSAVLARGTVSRTFEGRDRFAPAAAWLAIGTDLARFGPPAGALVPTPIPDPRSVADGVDGEVVRVDRFGNLVTNIPDAALLSLGPAVTIHAGDADIAGLVGTYAEAAPGALCAMTGSTGRLEVALNGGSAAAVLGGARGLVVRIRRRVGA